MENDKFEKATDLKQQINKVKEYLVQLETRLEHIKKIRDAGGVPMLCIKYSDGYNNSIPLLNVDEEDLLLTCSMKAERQISKLQKEFDKL